MSRDRIFSKLEKSGPNSGNQLDPGRGLCVNTPSSPPDRVLIQKKPLTPRFCDHCSRQRSEFVEISSRGFKNSGIEIFRKEAYVYSRL